MKLTTDIQPTEVTPATAITARAPTLPVRTPLSAMYPTSTPGVTT